MGQMRDSDWTRQILLRSDWSGPRVAPYTTDSFSRQEQCIDHIPYYLSGLSRAHFFRQLTFLEIAVNVTLIFSHIPIRKAHDKSNPVELPK